MYSQFEIAIQLPDQISRHKILGPNLSLSPAFILNFEPSSTFEIIVYHKEINCPKISSRVLGAAPIVQIRDSAYITVDSDIQFPDVQQSGLKRLYKKEKSLFMLRDAPWARKSPVKEALLERVCNKSFFRLGISLMGLGLVKEALLERYVHYSRNHFSGLKMCQEQGLCEGGYFGKRCLFYVRGQLRF